MTQTPETRQRAQSALGAWVRALGVCLLWFGLIGAVIGGMYLASIPDVPAIRDIDAAASSTPSPGTDAPPRDGPWQHFELPLESARCAAIPCIRSFAIASTWPDCRIRTGPCTCRSLMPTWRCISMADCSTSRDACWHRQMSTAFTPGWSDYRSRNCRWARTS